MCRLVFVVATHGRAFEIVVEIRREKRVDPIVQRRLISLHCQAVIGVGIDNRFGDFRLATHRVDSHQCPYLHIDNKSYTALRNVNI